MIERPDLSGVSSEVIAYIEALEWADRMGADVVSTSLGYRNWYGDDQFDGKTAPISIAASIAARRGLLIVTAMGNRDSAYYPWPEPYIVAPGDADGVITAVDLKVYVPSNYVAASNFLVELPDWWCAAAGRRAWPRHWPRGGPG